ncbi:Retinol dehydrogenase 14, partial [Ophiophagus hannah]
ARELRAEVGLCSRGGGECRGELVVHELDLASLSSVRSFCQQVLQEEPRLDVLINNAGIFQCPYMKTEDGFEMQFGVNHLGHFLLTNLLLGLLKSSAPSRIVVVSSKLYKYGEINFDDLNSELSYNKSFAYSRSKLGNILFTRELARRIQNTGVTVNVLHPGIVRTNLGRYIHIPLLAKPLFNLVSWAFFKSPSEGAQTIVYLSTSPEVEGVSGKYFGDCKEEQLLPKATDDLVARKLWDISEVMLDQKEKLLTRVLNCKSIIQFRHFDYMGATFCKAHASSALGSGLEFFWILKGRDCDAGQESKWKLMTATDINQLHRRGIKHDLKAKMTGMRFTSPELYKTSGPQPEIWHKMGQKLNELSEDL